MVFAASLRDPAAADRLRVVNWNVQMARAGPGLLLRDLERGRDGQIRAAVRVLVALDADIVLLTGFDYDLGAEALTAFSDLLAASGLSYPHRFALRPNTGVSTGFDLDGDGRLGGPGDAQGFGAFPGQGAMALLSRLPLDTDRAVDLSDLLWRDLPGASPPPMPPDQADVLRLSTTGHWIVPVRLPDGRLLSLMAWYASPPVFGGPEARNARRNHDETALWLRLIEGALPVSPPAPPFLLIGDANLDPADGEGRRAALQALLSSPRLTDPQPRGSHGRVEPGQRGDPALDTVLFKGVGGLRVDYILPSADLHVLASGVMWPGPRDPLAADLAAASRHRPVWVEIAWP